MKVALIAFSEKGCLLGSRLQECFLQNGDSAELCRCENGQLSAWTAAHFSYNAALIFIGAAGIAVRAIAPHVKSKVSDPAVVVVDELGAYSVSLLSGHLGGANDLALRIAAWLNAIPVVTTATDRNGIFAVDSWAKKQGLTITNPVRIKWVSAKLLGGETALLKSFFPISGALPDGVAVAENHYDILISYRTRGREEALRLVPPVVTLGVGCRRDTPAEAIEDAYQLMLKMASCHPAAVRQVCSIDLKAQEPGILGFCQSHSLPFRTFSAAELAAVPGSFSGSAFVQSVTGVDNVCERSAVLGSGGRLLTQKNAEHGVTMALAIEPYTVHFQKEERA